MPQRTIRGAITTDDNAEAILKDTREMLEKIIFENNIKKDDITSIIFTATKDITKIYPAACARKMNIVHASLMCVQEMFVEGSLEKCIRCMVTVQTDKAQEQMKHVYLKEARKLRPDLTCTGDTDITAYKA